MKPRCLNCGKEPAINKEPWGYLPGKKCQKKVKELRLGETIEQVTEAIKEDRKEYSKDIEQRYVGGNANKKYIKYYGAKGFTKEEVSHAVNSNHGFYKDE